MRTAPYPTLGRTVAIDVPRLCPVCLACGLQTPLEQVDTYAWICPRQRDEARRVSAELRTSVKADALAIDDKIGF
jgi:hypothetical protein